MGREKQRIALKRRFLGRGPFVGMLQLGDSYGAYWRVFERCAIVGGSQQVHYRKKYIFLSSSLYVIRMKRGVFFVCLLDS